jgi:hypothetical protein
MIPYYNFRLTPIYYVVVIRSMENQTTFTRHEATELLGVGPISTYVWKLLVKKHKLIECLTPIHLAWQAKLPVWRFTKPIPEVREAALEITERRSQTKAQEDGSILLDRSPLVKFLRDAMVVDGWDGETPLISLYPRVPREAAAALSNRASWAMTFHRAREIHIRALLKPVRNQLLSKAPAVFSGKLRCLSGVLTIATANDFGTPEDPSDPENTPFRIYPTEKDPSNPMLVKPVSYTTPWGVVQDLTNITWVSHPPEYIRDYVTDLRETILVKKAAKATPDGLSTTPTRRGRAPGFRVADSTKEMLRTRHKLLQETNRKEFAARWWADPLFRSRLPLSDLPKSIKSDILDATPPSMFAPIGNTETEEMQAEKEKLNAEALPFVENVGILNSHPVEPTNELPESTESVVAPEPETPAIKALF